MASGDRTNTHPTKNFYNHDSKATKLGIFMKINMITAAMAVLALSACDVQKTESGKMPDVDVDVSADAGKLPSFDVDWAEVDVGTTTKMVKVPKIVVVMEEEEVEVPYMDIIMPGDDSERTQRTVMVEAEVEGQMHDLRIDKVYATKRQLFVVSTLTPTEQSLEGKKVRVSDRIELNAPDLKVQHIIVGEKPMGDWNNRYDFVADESALQARVQGAKEIYSR